MSEIVWSCDGEDRISWHSQGKLNLDEILSNIDLSDILTKDELEEAIADIVESEVSHYDNDYEEVDVSTWNQTLVIENIDEIWDSLGI